MAFNSSRQSRRTFVKQAAAGSLAALAAPAIVAAAKTDVETGRRRRRRSPVRGQPSLGPTSRQVHLADDAQRGGRRRRPGVRHSRRPPRPAGPPGDLRVRLRGEVRSGVRQPVPRRRPRPGSAEAKAATSSSTSPRTSRSGRSPSSRPTAKRCGTNTRRWRRAATPTARTSPREKPTTTHGAATGSIPPTSRFHPDGGFLLADGYGSFRIHRYDADGNWQSAFGSPRTKPTSPTARSTRRTACGSTTARGEAAGRRHRPGQRPAAVVHARRRAPPHAGRLPAAGQRRRAWATCC